MVKLKDKRGLVGTIIVHVGLLVLFMFLSFTKPCTEEDGGILINFVTDEQGTGMEEPRNNEAENPMSATSASETEASEQGEEILTQDYEDAPAIPIQSKKNERKKDDSEKINNEIENTKKNEREVSQEFLFPSAGKNNNSSNSVSEGITEGTGNQGDENGSVNSNNYNGGYSEGIGISTNLSGRSPVKLFRPRETFQEEGVVVVEIKVDREGNVIEVRAGVKNSTTLNDHLLSIAEKAARETKFNSHPNAPVIQKGTITYNFKLN